MAESEAIVRLLTEIRDEMRRNVAESQRTREEWREANEAAMKKTHAQHEEWRELNEAAIKKADAQHKQSIAAGRTMSGAFTILIVIFLAVNFFMLILVAGRK